MCLLYKIVSKIGNQQFGQTKQIYAICINTI